MPHTTMFDGRQKTEKRKEKKKRHTLNIRNKHKLKSLIVMDWHNNGDGPGERIKY